MPHKTYLKALKAHFQADWGQPIAPMLVALVDDLYSFRDYLIPATHAVKDLVEKGLRTAIGLQLSHVNGILSDDEARTMVTDYMRPQLLAINVSLKGYKGIPLAPYFPPILEHAVIEEAKDIKEAETRNEEIKKLAKVKDIDELSAITSRAIASAFKALKGRPFAVVDDIGVIPPLYDYEKKISGVHRITVDQGGFGYIALHGEQLLLVDEDFHKEMRAKASAAAQGTDRLKAAREAEKAAKRKLDELNLDLDELNQQIEDNRTTRNAEKRKQVAADLTLSHQGLMARISEANNKVASMHDAYVGLRRSLREGHQAAYGEAEASTVADMLAQVGPDLTLMSDKPRRMPREYGERRIMVYWIGREAHLRRTASKLPATLNRGKFVEWDIVGRDD